ncbi:hypothetical protein [Pedobacter steynii]|uniref:Uncharacterized protein n=1 Tax=Pedobacter steynii TaxID=430522 RepID=A0A1D7QLI5_9SPHI|nr:hypothetical protein [Pedobacter steynii]AOM79536.1 hypothetical protein BFS30_21670 [Pedobacter steynii]
MITETLTSTDSWFLRIIAKFAVWMTKKSKKPNGKLNLAYFITISTAILMLSSFLHLGEFYAAFDIAYFSFFSFEDALSLLYEKGRLFLLFPMIIGFVAIAIATAHTFRKKNIHKELKRNSFILFTTIVIGLTTGQAFRAVGNLPWLSAIFVGVFSAAIVIMYFYFHVITIYLYPMLIGFGLVLSAGPDVERVVKEKISFDLTLVDGKDPMPIVQNKKTYWIGTTSKIMYLYNDSTRKITEVSVSQIQTISFIRPKKNL